MPEISQGDLTPPSPEQQIETYERDRQIFKEEYGRDLDKPSENLKVSVVIPSFAELKNDNFWRLFRSLMYQRGVRPDEYEVIVVVNNSAEIANHPVNQSVEMNTFEGTTGELRMERYRENQDHLTVMKIAKKAQEMVGNGEKVAVVNDWLNKEIEDKRLELSDYEKKLMIRFARTQVSLQFVDASSPDHGLALDDHTSPIGLVRDIGSYLAYERFKETGASGIVDFIDGDCFFPPNYMRSLLDQREMGVDVVVKPLRKVVAEIPREITEQPNRFVRVMSTVRYLTGVLASRDYTDVTIDLFDADTIGYPIYPVLGGPQLAVRSSALPDVGGYPTYRKNSDFAFSREVVNKYQGPRIGTLIESSVLMSDRGRDVSIDGKSKLKLFEDPEIDYLDRPAEFKFWTDGRLMWIKQKDEFVRHELTIVAGFGSYTLEELISEYERNLDMVYRREADQRVFTIEKVGRLLELISSQGLENMQITEIINEMHRLHQISGSDVDFFQQNMVLVELAIDSLAMAKYGSEYYKETAIEAMGFLKRLLPEYFEVPPEKRPSASDITKDDNIANYYHVMEAIYITRAKIREGLLRGGRG